MTDKRRRENRELTGTISAQNAAAARKANTPWRRGPHVKKRQNHQRFNQWRGE
jgi:hypothetical protein